MKPKTPAGSFNDIHTAFVTSDSGTTLAELTQVLGALSVTPLLISLLIPWIVPPSFVKPATLNKEFYFLINVIIEYPFLIALPVWTVTVLTNQETPADDWMTCSGLLCVIIMLAVFFLMIVNHSITAPKWSGFFSEWSKLKETPLRWGSRVTNTQTTPEISNKLPFITNYRAIVISTTVLCILAVDFPVFPRRFAKTHKYGISLMDVGTGCFVFANGIVAPEARNKVSPIISSLKSTVPIIILGFVRLISVKGIEYQEVVEEYGVHWNFFFTLAAVKVLSSLLFWAVDSSNGVRLGVTIALLYEFLLNYNDFQANYILNPNVPRNESLINANREGIYSTIGYLTIYLLSVCIAKVIMHKKRDTFSNWLQYGLQAFLQVVILWGLYFAAVHYGNFPCRRTANLSYVLLMVALNYSLLWIQLMIGLAQIVIRHFGLLYGPLVFYELAAFHKRQVDRMTRLSKHFEEVKKKNLEKMEAERIDAKLHQLEVRLEQALAKVKTCKLGTAAEQKLSSEIKSIESEFLELEGTLTEENSSTQSEDSSKVLLPDLCGSPVILQAICYNGLAVFLLGNLLTGLINSLVYTMYTSNYLAICYLWAYMTLVCAGSVSLYWMNIQLKFW